MAGASPQLSRCATQIREHYASTYGRSPPINLEAELDRVAMDTRAYDVRSVLGGKHLRGSLGLGPSSVTAYLAQDAAEHLPLFEVFRARVVAEVHVRQDRSEASSLALRVVALARVLTKEDGIQPLARRGASWSEAASEGSASAPARRAEFGTEGGRRP